MYRGYVKTYRALKDWCYFRNSSAVHLLTFIILEANYKPEKKQFGKELIIVQPGQLLTGRKFLSSNTGISESSIERWLKKFEECGEIEQRKSTKNRLITLLKWEQFQESEQQADNERTTSGQQADTPKKEKKEKKEKNNYVDVFNFYCSLDLINHKELTKDMTKGMEKASRELNINTDTMKTMLERHAMKVEATAKSEYPTKKRTLAEFFGQKKYQSVSLICTDYLDCAWEQYEAKVNKKESPQELLARLKAEGRI